MEVKKNEVELKESTINAKTTTKTKAKTKATRKVATQKKFNKDDEILCRSITVGGLYLDGLKSKEFYSWVEYGDEEYVQYQDLVAMVRNKRSDYIYGPLIIIEDDDFISEFPQLKDFYDSQYQAKDLEGILELPVADMIATIENLPQTAKNSLKSIASTQVSNDQLDSVRKIRALDELFGTELDLLSRVLSS